MFVLIDIHVSMKSFLLTLNARVESSRLEGKKDKAYVPTAFV